LRDSAAKGREAREKFQGSKLTAQCPAPARCYEWVGPSSCVLASDVEQQAEMTAVIRMNTAANAAGFSAGPWMCSLQPDEGDWRPVGFGSSGVWRGDD
jgi:hypothetical protein